MGLLRKVRFPLMEEGCLAGLTGKAWAADSEVDLDGLVADALSLQAEQRQTWDKQGLERLDGRALVARCRERLEQILGGRGRRLDAGNSVHSLAANFGGRRRSCVWWAEGWMHSGVEQVDAGAGADIDRA
jgi:hypothetical protein